MIEDYKAGLKKLIAENKIMDVIERIMDFSISNGKLKDEIVLIGSRLSDLEDKIKKGVLDPTDENKIKNQIVYSLLKLINNINENDYIILIENSEITINLKKELANKKNEISNYKTKIKDLERKILKLEQLKITLENEASNNKKTIQTLKELQFEKLVKHCKKCNGEGTLSDNIIIKLKFKTTLDPNFMHDIGWQILNQLKPYNLTSEEEQTIILSISTLDAMSNLIHRQYLMREVPRKILCQDCEGTGISKVEPYNK